MSKIKFRQDHIQHYNAKFMTLKILKNQKKRYKSIKRKLNGINIFKLIKCSRLQIIILNNYHVVTYVIFLSKCRIIEKK